MRLVLLCTLGLAMLTAIPAPAPAQFRRPYRIDVDPRTTSRIHDGKRLVTVQFQIRRSSDNSLDTSVRSDDIVVEEDGQRVHLPGSPDQGGLPSDGPSVLSSGGQQTTRRYSGIGSFDPHILDLA